MTMEPNQKINQETLDRLVDGELNDTRRRDVIEALGRDRDGWKRCALAFLESQSFGQEMRRAYRDDPPCRDDHRADSMVADASPTVERPRRAGRRFRQSNFCWWLTAAACVVFAFAWGTRLQPVPVTPSNASPAIVESLPKDGTEHQLVGSPTADIWRGESMVPADIEDMLNRLGQQVDRQKGLMPLVSADGSQVLVPFEDVRIRPARDAPQ
jgi:hypothetical protein